MLARKRALYDPAGAPSTLPRHGHVALPSVGLVLLSGTTEAVQAKSPETRPRISNAGISRRCGTAGDRESLTMLNNFSTPSWDSLNLHTLKKTGPGEYHGPCPVSKQGTDCFWIQPERKLLGCRSCSLDGGRLEGQQFKEHLEALGLTFGEHDVLAPYEWTNYLTGETVVQTRHAGEPKYRWPKGVTLRGLVYLARHDREATRPIVWTEGGKAADAAAAKLPADDYDVIGFVSSSTIPNDATLKALTKGRSCIVWPDDDLPGAKVGTRLCAAPGPVSLGRADGRPGSARAHGWTWGRCRTMETGKDPEG